MSNSPDDELDRELLEAQAELQDTVDSLTREVSAFLAYLDEKGELRKTIRSLRLWVATWIIIMVLCFAGALIFVGMHNFVAVLVFLALMVFSALMIESNRKSLRRLNDYWKPKGDVSS